MLNRPRVLMLAYACDPRGTGEHWLGWGWAEQAARSFAVELVTTPKARSAIQESAQALGITPHFVEVPAAVRKLTELAGGSWWRKLAWQKRALGLAAELHARQPFELVHQTTFHTFRVPFLAAGLGIPSVWGPIAGGESVPPGFETYLGRARYPELSRRWVNRLCLRHPAVARSLRQASALLVSNRTTLDFLPSHCRAKARLVAPNALRPQDEQFLPPPNVARAPGRPFKLLYVGNCVATRAIPLVFEALRDSGLTQYEFTILGGGPALADWKARAQRLGLGAAVRFAGKVPHAELSSYYAAADVLVFPALRDSGGSALLEAMARYVPVICLDWGGPGEMVDEHSGLKIPVTTPAETARAFGAALRSVQQGPELRARLATAARARAVSRFGWQAKRELLEETYQRLLSV